MGAGGIPHSKSRVRPLPVPGRPGEGGWGAGAAPGAHQISGVTLVSPDSGCINSEARPRSGFEGGLGRSRGAGGGECGGVDVRAEGHERGRRGGRASGMPAVRQPGPGPRPQGRQKRLGAATSRSLPRPETRRRPPGPGGPSIRAVPVTFEVKIRSRLSRIPGGDADASGGWRTQTHPLVPSHRADWPVKHFKPGPWRSGR